MIISWYLSQIFNFKALKLGKIRLFGDFVLKFKGGSWEYNRNCIGNKVLVVVLLSQVTGKSSSCYYHI